MRPVSVQNCQRCGAPLPYEQDSGPRECTYCGTVETAPTPEPAPLPIDSVKERSWLRPRGGVVTLGAIVLYLAFRFWPSAEPVHPPKTSLPRERRLAAEEEKSPSSPPVSEHGILSGLLLFDANGDGQEDLLAVSAPPRQSTAKRRLIAINGQDGTELWRRPMDPRASPAETLRAVLRDTVLLSSPQGDLVALAANTGSPLWQRALGRPVEALCEGQGFFGVTSSGRFEAFATAMGTSMQADRRACRPAYTSRSAAPNYAYVEGAALSAWLPKGEELLALRGLLPTEGVARVVLGTESSSTNGTVDAPVVGVAAHRRWLWRTLLAGDDPTAQLPIPALAAVRRERVVVASLGQDRTVLRVTSFELAQGRRQWDLILERIQLPEQVSVSDVAASTDGRVFVRSGAGRLWAVELAGTVGWSR